MSVSASEAGSDPVGKRYPPATASRALMPCGVKRDALRARNESNNNSFAVSSASPRPVRSIVWKGCSATPYDGSLSSVCTPGVASGVGAPTTPVAVMAGTPVAGFAANAFNAPRTLLTRASTALCTVLPRVGTSAPFMYRDAIELPNPVADVTSAAEPAHCGSLAPAPEQ